MRINLKVPYQEKDKAKKLGAKWDGVEKTWYIVNKEDLEPFLDWIPAKLKIPHKRLKHNSSSSTSSLPWE